MRMMGTLTVDAGCAKALVKGGSLLATGVTSVDGSFERGDPVIVQDAAGKPIAQGLAEYSSAECERLKGTRSDEHAAILGYAQPVIASVIAFFLLSEVPGHFALIGGATVLIGLAYATRARATA